jgi:hypothetical protein
MKRKDSKDMQGKGNQGESIARSRVLLLKTALRLILTFSVLCFNLILKNLSIAPILMPTTSLFSSQHDLTATVPVD